MLETTLNKEKERHLKYYLAHFALKIKRLPKSEFVSISIEFGEQLPNITPGRFSINQNNVS